MKKTTPRICFDRVVPDSYNPGHAETLKALTTQHESVLREYRALAARFSQHELHADDPVAVARMALIDHSKWQNGKTLRCRFLDGSTTQQNRVVTKAKIWESYANITLDFTTSPDAEIRISFHADPGSWSAVGTDCLVATYFPKYQPTMNFGWLEDDTDDEEYERVVVHEFGHALGCIHEHQSPSEHLHWNVDAVYETFSGPPNYWSKEDIDSNILEKYSPRGVSYTRFDRHSIMLYQFDATLFTDHKGTPLNTHLSAGDERMIARMYPKAAPATIALSAAA